MSIVRPGLASLRDQDGVTVIYDGECPFCSRYVKLTRLRDAVGAVKLVDARTRPDLVREMRQIGLDINSGMAVQYEGALHFGSDAMTILSLLSSQSGVLNRLLANVFRYRRTTAVLYPILRTGRNAVLRLLGRSTIPTSD